MAEQQKTGNEGQENGGGEQQQQQQIDMAKYIELPTEGATPEQIAAVYERLGSLKTPEDYAALSESDVVKNFSKTFHEAKLTKSQVEAIDKGWNEFITAQQQQVVATSQAQVEELKTEWGKDYETNMNEAKQVVAKLGFTKDDMQLIELGIGTKNIIKLFYNIAVKTREGRIKGGDSGNKTDMKSMPTDPATAKAKIEELTKDTAFAQKIANGDAEASKLFNDLHRVAYPGGK